MRIGLNIVWPLALLSSSTGVVLAQGTPNTPAPTVVMGGQLGAVVAAPMQGAIMAIPASGSLFKPMTGAPYSAQQVMEHVQTLADGTHITQTTQQTMLYRDSEGRTRTEHTFTPPNGAVMAAGPSFVEITDPAAGYRYFLDQHNHVARRQAWRPVGDRGRQAPARIVPAPVQPLAPSMTVNQSQAVGAASQRPHPEMAHESLGTQLIEGINANGTRLTITYPEGLIGNDRPITTVSETWMSPELGMIILSKTSDPRSGESTTKLTNISRTEPDPALFQIPADYSVVDEPAPVPLRQPVTNR
jgi:hypothetical protein